MPGARILHLHARDPKYGRPSPDPNIFMRFLPRIKQATDAVVNITTGGAVTMTVEQRMSAALQLSPKCVRSTWVDEFCALSDGTPLQELEVTTGRRLPTQFRYLHLSNTFRHIEKIYKALGDGHGVKFEHECYDTGHLYNLAHCIDPPACSSRRSFCN